MFDDKLNTKSKRSYMTILAFCLLMMFGAALADTQGRLLFIAYIASLFLICLLTNEPRDMIIFSAAVLINSELVDGTLAFISIRRVLIVLVFIFLVLCINRNREQKLVVPGWCYIVLLCYLLIDDTILHQRSLISELTMILLVTFSYLLQVYAAENRKNADKIILSVIIGVLFVTIIAYVEICTGHTFFYSLWTGTERYRYGILRPGSTVSDPNNICLVLVPMLFLLETKGACANVSYTLRKIIELLMLIMIILTSSRAGLTALAVGIAVYFLMKRKVYFLIGVPFVGLLSNFILSKLESLLSLYQESTSFRNYVVEIALTAWSQNPLFGNEGNAVSEILDSGSSENLYNTMNTYVFMLMCYGLIGLILLIIFLFLMIKTDILEWIKIQVPERDVVLKFSAVVSMAIIMYTLDTFYIAMIWILPAFFTAIQHYNSVEVEQKKIRFVL